MRALISAAVAVALLGIPAATMAQSRPDPMRAAASAAGTPSADDPMAALRAPAQDPEAEISANEELGGLPDARGAEDTFYQCTACHSTEIIKQQRITDARWDDLWQWMVDEQGMFEPEPETKTVILDYLKAHFSSER
ncbi:MAG: cytochrome C-552 [Paracoccus sp. (in: a-proteobacteria)]|jgi:hypothetical protein|uniref:Cytochrome C-552 n=1 Tax=Paracoccus maritimus TaxID=2933292 RepID=A0ABT2KD98_9RHOB|nr:cytochrome C-552 [Paracoccus sp. YLB-12]MCT4334341.1 cytochrome C-552 [Paracoccus sp. YLB-12]|tara:strand:+ start:89 stop:499 length:411 start_codon:yes stop_codon:yes gene_type:complete